MTNVVKFPVAKKKPSPLRSSLKVRKSAFIIIQYGDDSLIFNLTKMKNGENQSWN